MRSRPFFIGVSLVWCVTLSAQNPQITNIKQEYATIENNIRSATYRINKRAIEDDNLMYEAVLYEDSHGRIRKLLCVAGSEDSAHSGEYYYRSDGGMFFSYTHYATVHGCAGELRSYYDSHGKLIKTIRSKDECHIGIGYPRLVADPKKYFINLCDPSK